MVPDRSPAIDSETYPRRRIAARLGLGFVLWGVVAIGLVPLALALAHRGALPFADLLLRGRATIPLCKYQELWWWSAVWVTALGGTAVVFATERRWLGRPAVSVAVLIAATFLFHLAALRDGI